MLKGAFPYALRNPFSQAAQQIRETYVENYVQHVFTFCASFCTLSPSSYHNRTLTFPRISLLPANRSHSPRRLLSPPEIQIF